MATHNVEQSIIAQCTPTGSGALALLRVSGAHSLTITQKISQLASGKAITDVDSHTIHFGHINNGERVVDQVMFIVMKAPRTFTGEDVVEITCHNNQFIIEDIIQLFVQHGARMAQNGEFAKRAYLHGKIDLLQAESINELIHASNQQSLKKSLEQVTGSFSSWIAKIEKQLIQCLALSEASFEFLDDEMEFGPQILVIIQEVLHQLGQAQQAFNNQQSIREGVRVAILGCVNAGKSSLFNALIKKDRAIVTPIAGTTRDSIEAGIYTKDCFVTLVDTAGIRQTDDIVEKEGIKRSFEEAKKADIVLLVVDISRPMTEQEEEFYRDIIEQYTDKCIVIENKLDLVAKPIDTWLKECGIDETLCTEHKTGSTIKKTEQDTERTNLDTPPTSPKIIKVSAQSKKGIDKLEAALHQKIASLLQANNSPFLLNKRHAHLLIDVQNKLQVIQSMLEYGNVEYEILSIHLKEALESLSELTGKTISEMGMDAVFKEFCVGK